MALAWKAGWVHALTSSNLVSSARLTRNDADRRSLRRCDLSPWSQLWHLVEVRGASSEVPQAIWLPSRMPGRWRFYSVAQLLQDPGGDRWGVTYDCPRLLTPPGVPASLECLKTLGAHVHPKLRGYELDHVFKARAKSVPANRKVKLAQARRSVARRPTTAPSASTARGRHHVRQCVPVGVDLYMRRGDLRSGVTNVVEPKKRLTGRAAALEHFDVRPIDRKVALLPIKAAGVEDLEHEQATTTHKQRYSRVWRLRDLEPGCLLDCVCFEGATGGSDRTDRLRQLLREVPCLLGQPVAQRRSSR